MMSSHTLRVLSSIASRSSRAARQSTCNVTNISRAAFSAQPEAALTPGIGLGKTSTGLVGLEVDHDAVPKMITKYQALLDKLAASDMPPTSQYRINVEKIARYRIAAAQNNLDDPEAVEELCNCGQVEELVVQADNEMKVMDMYLRNRWWELVKPVDIEYNPSDEDGGHGDVEWGDTPDGEKK
mmetsp:Transcript_3004/g.4302  ORF Transcript_3004/g.4302 Transcript_3004/m.4302 type:complete len:183 (-) Transcript_3004:269-817(-)|eukprot:CAMPEP_0201687066 /NCGR_PEP_ID=MMETSP0578-20130828/1279_1 /ASSEMBLY_ACC=CAM_ASM_000663 /TAXON_ID=267565 /ORGANISM="Skeletonema grethea, Strain CCMP 1804" /LENGTH=182 /DNA_ID=CAMNT_0048171189 /DNA_START=38 /DNA_END=586 /DNA_ORIENTATION=-